MLKFILRTVAAGLVATALAWVMALVGVTVPSTAWTDQAAPGLAGLGRQLGLFFLLSLAGFALLRGVLKGEQGSALLYLGGGAVVGLVAAVLSVAAFDVDLAFRPGLLLGGVLCGLVGGLPISGSGSRPAVLTPLRRGRKPQA